MNPLKILAGMDVGGVSKSMEGLQIKGIVKRRTLKGLNTLGIVAILDF